MERPKRVRKAPWLYTMAARLRRRRWRGSTLLFNTLSRLGLFDCVVSFPLTDALSVETPLYTDNLWDEASVQSYESALIRYLAQEARSLPPPVRLVDCGASFGLFSMRMAAAAPFLEDGYPLRSGIHNR